MSLSRTVFGSEFLMAGAVQWNVRFAIVVLVNGRHSAGVADRRCRLWTSSLSWSRRPGVGDEGRTSSTCCGP